MAIVEGRKLEASVLTLTCLSFMLIGYDNGLMGGLINQTAFERTFNLVEESEANATMVGVIVAIFEIGCFIGALMTSIIGERLGRRWTIMSGTIIMIIGSLLQATAYTRSHMIVARVVAGVGLGFVNSTAPVLQSEYSPKANRGLFVCMQLSTLNFGIFLVYWIDYAFSLHDGDWAWRVPVILQCFFLLIMVALVLLIPETPRWLAAHDRGDESLAVLRRLHGKRMSDEDIRALHADILETVRTEKALGQARWRDMLKSDRLASRRRFLIACGIQAFQQLGGINAIIYYSGTLFEKSLGFDRRMAALMSGFLQTWFFIASFIPYALIDRFGRRPLLLSMISLMAAVMAVQSALIYQVQNETAIATAAGTGAAAMLFIFQGAFTVGFQATVWVYPTEILPLRIRQRGSSISTGCNWIMNYLIVQVTPIAIETIGWRTYIIFAVLNATWVPIIYIFFPETKGLELEDVDKMFINGGVTAHSMRTSARSGSFAGAEDTWEKERSDEEKVSQVERKAESD